MGFERLKFTKTWASAVDFPTVESDEAQVRADMQLLHDESRDGLNRTLDALESSAAAATLGAVGPQGEESTIQAELDGLHQGMIQAGALPVGGSTDQVLAKGSEENYETKWVDVSQIIKVLLGAANGVASLNDEGEIPLSQISRALRSKINAGLPWQLIDTIDSTRGYSGQWEAPDVFGDGSTYDIGVYMFGGGESGAAAVHATEYTGENGMDDSASGGASGYGRNAVIRTVAPGTVYSWVIGKGGVGGSVTKKDGYGNAAKVPGGTTSFGGITAAGGGSVKAGAGGQPSSGRTGGTNRDFYGCVIDIDGPDSYGYTMPQNPREGQNQFDPLMMTLACGFGAGTYVSYDSDDGTQAGYTRLETPEGDNPTPGQLGLGASKCVVDYSVTEVIVTAGRATNGNGGGGAAAVHGGRDSATATATAGSGGDGMIFLYARKAVV